MFVVSIGWDFLCSNIWITVKNIRRLLLLLPLLCGNHSFAHRKMAKQRNENKNFHRPAAWTLLSFFTWCIISKVKDARVPTVHCALFRRHSWKHFNRVRMVLHLNKHYIYAVTPSLKIHFESWSVFHGNFFLFSLSLRLLFIWNFMCAILYWNAFS